MQWVQENWPLIVTVLWGLCEVLALIPVVKSNSVFTLIYNTARGLKERLLPAGK